MQYNTTFVMGNCFDAYWGKRELKQLDKKRARVGEQFAVLVNEHDKSIESNEIRRSELQLRRVQLIQRIQAKRSPTEPINSIKPTRSEQQQIMQLVREIAAVERRISTALAERANVARSRDHVTTALTHHTTSKVKQRVYEQVSKEAGLNIEDMEKTRDDLAEADENLLEIVDVMHARSVTDAEHDDDSELMSEVMGEFMAALNGEQTHTLTTRDTGIEMAENSNGVGVAFYSDSIDATGRRGRPASGVAPLILADNISPVPSSRRRQEESDEELLLS